jgi:hypothetical protein
LNPHSRFRPADFKLPIAVSARVHLVLNRSFCAARFPASSREFAVVQPDSHQISHQEKNPRSSKIQIDEIKNETFREGTF